MQSYAIIRKELRESARHGNLFTFAKRELDRSLRLTATQGKASLHRQGDLIQTARPTWPTKPICLLQSSRARSSSYLASWSVKSCKMTILEIQEPRFISKSEAARILGCSEITIDRFITAKKLHGFKVGEKLVRLDLAEVLSFAKPILRTSTSGASSLMASGDVFTKVS